VKIFCVFVKRKKLQLQLEEIRRALAHTHTHTPKRRPNERVCVRVNVFMTHGWFSERETKVKRARARVVA